VKELLLIVQIGDWLILSVEDNGEGSNADPDRIGDGLILVPPFVLDFILNFGGGDVAGFFASVGVIDAASPTNIQVN
jgi:hypothetical protein